MISTFSHLTTIATSAEETEGNQTGPEVVPLSAPPTLLAPEKSVMMEVVRNAVHSSSDTEGFVLSLKRVAANNPTYGFALDTSPHNRYFLYLLALEIAAFRAGRASNMTATDGTVKRVVVRPTTAPTTSLGTITPILQSTDHKKKSSGVNSRRKSLLSARLPIRDVKFIPLQRPILRPTRNMTAKRERED